MPRWPQYQASKKKMSSMFDVVDILADQKSNLVGVRREMAGNQCVSIVVGIWRPSGIVAHHVSDFGLMSMYANLDFCEAAIRAAANDGMPWVDASSEAAQRVGQSLDALDWLLDCAEWKTMLADALRSCYHEIGAAGLAYHLVLCTVDCLAERQAIPEGCKRILDAIQAWLDKNT
jgi:hypothetical protein